MSSVFKRLVIAIFCLMQAKPYSWMPGSGMSIEVTVSGYERPYIFGAILSRDEAMESILSHALKADLPWAKCKKSSLSLSEGTGKEGEREYKDSEDSLSVASQSSSPRASPGRRRKVESHQDEEA